MAFHKGQAAPYFKCPYQAKVMKTFEKTRRRTVRTMMYLVIVNHTSSTIKKLKMRKNKYNNLNINIAIIANA